MPENPHGAQKAAYLACGQIVKPQGLRGELKVQPLTDDPQRFETMEFVHLQQGSGYQAVAVVSLRLHEGFAYIKLQGINDRDAAEAVRGQYLWVDRANAVKLPEGRYYIADILGSLLVDETGKSYGRVKDVIQTGANDVYVIEQGAREWMLPALKNIILQYVLDEGHILIDPSQLLEEDPDAY